MKKINIALIGAGYISDYHARGLLTMPQVALVAVVSKHLGNAEKFASKYGIKNAYSSITPVVEDPTIDAVIISTPNSFHAPYAIEFLKNGKDVFLEKPMAMNAGEGEQIAQVADEKDRLVMVGHMWRFDTETQFIKDSIDAGELGKVFKTN